jgi:conjugative transfer signal peptidase TraF
MNSRIYSSGLSSVGPVSSRQSTAKNRPFLTIAMLALGVPALTCPKANVPSLIWNLSPSVPVGLYRLTAGAPLTGVLAVIRLPEPFNTLASTRGYLPAGAPLIKRVAAGCGDLVCRHGALVTINGRAVARARPFDSAGQPLPRWTGCISLGTSQIFVLSADPDSFDSRYIRAVNRRDVLGAAVSVWVRPTPSPSPAALEKATPRCELPLQLAHLRLLELLECTVQLSQRPHHLFPQRREIGDRIVLAA